MKNLCISCNNIILEPLCSECLVKELGNWLKEEPLKNIEINYLNYNLNAFTKEFERKFLKLKCDLCKFNMIPICSQCISNKIAQILSKDLKSEKVLNKFLCFFNQQKIIADSRIENKNYIGRLKC